MGVASVVPEGRKGDRNFHTAKTAITPTVAMPANSHGLRHSGRTVGTGIIVSLATAAEGPRACVTPVAELVGLLTGTVSLLSTATLRSELVSRLSRFKSARISDADW
jgi:predicted aconitase with swiveling domain